jgi:hypothetical protein
MQVADINVSRSKFEREVSHLRLIEPTLVARGWWIMRTVFPIVKVAFSPVKVTPRMIPFAVAVDFTDYDARPLSVKFVDPFHDRELGANEMMHKLLRRIPAPALSLPETEVGHEPIVIPLPLDSVVELYQHYPQFPTLPGFLCLPGVREYHDHPAHSGDPWELHRSAGEGRLFNLLETVWRYGSDPLLHLNFNMAMSFAQAELPQ